ncbi:three-Cys-motif partner protein TcmP [Arsenicicoccus piscis]|uniref:Three-Cys-motif partner protein TcmP n=1 Tax=Arsenicicoccus piscis TaxID=673954 RepID=A0ABQ6HQN4_9MICO|nr:three-Cys-motif partner protein TcmP [Arsenicicoccus piscis]MCH8629268.1 three-Cys-motif partner protein TcmP [Arsenicicoccus piscis]GMA19774.1 hypothetical protein GCM10025862_17950 [Arsenicicoccus piscis]
MSKGDRLPTVWELSPHTKAKHDILTRYLGAWFGIFGNTQHHSAVNVLDGFAGPGRYSKGEPGSPILALKTLLEHTSFNKFRSTAFHFGFNEQDPQRHASLKREVAALKSSYSPWPSNVVTEEVNENFQDLVRNLLGSLKPKHVLAPTFAFVDPFGYRDVPMSLLQELSKQPAFELFIYFDFNSVNRFATAGNVDSHFDTLFGCEDYRLAPSGGMERQTFLHDLYESQLRSMCGFEYVRSFGMINQRGHTGNYLFFCTNHLLAYDRMKAAMWKLSPSGDYRFDDRLAGRQVLFENEADTAPLQVELAQHFAGKTIKVEDVKQYVITKTPFYSGQLKMLTLKPMQDAGRLTSPNQKTKGRFPDGTLIEFPKLSE